MSLFEPTAELVPAKKKPWDKQTREKPEYFEAFEAYLGQEERSLQIIADKYGWKLAYCADIAKLYNWDARANAYDFHKTEAPIAQIISSKETSIKSMTEDHIQLARKAQRVAMNGLGVLEKFIQESEFARAAGEDMPAKPYMKAEDIVKLAKFGVDVERMAMGEATSRSETKATDYSKLSDVELKQLSELLAKSEGEDV